ncbi:DUF475 domain-containing protein [Planotetraspora sp. A-T 1434]|uniref:DUF475 domain-containing protein n=1 Tax=Planotetraspora sp. A-T 1434 TaxID=2979219 RepID=UPI0021C22535|nr:DUF475 domain-containing protein [Planotetraspora sp. A-T 1434]MCT9930315.1 DUF475 domain-containing protein [Planotetraspora sp. A-T 1434]
MASPGGGTTVWRTFGWSLGVSLAALLIAYLVGGAEVVPVVLILAILEISLSFDNAVVNALVLRRMDVFWQRMFLTVGILIAVFGMRLIFPFIVVGLTAGLGPASVVDLAMNRPDLYADRLHAAHPAIAAFGGMFLLMIFLDFIVEERDDPWLRPIERVFVRFGRIQSLSTIIALIGLLLASRLAEPAGGPQVLVAGVLGLVTYLAVSALGDFFEEQGGGQSRAGARSAGAVGLSLFLYLEVLDASFSFDGVVAAFAITSNIFVITLGLGIGALYIRSTTVYLVRAGTLEKYIYLEHGAHYAIGALALLLLAGIRLDIPELVTGLIGVGLILAAFVSSLIYNRRAVTREPVTADDPVRS